MLPTQRLSAAPHVHATTSYSQVIQSKYLRFISNHPRRTLTSHLHNPPNIDPIPVLIHPLNEKFFSRCLSDPNPLVQQIGNYTLADATNVYRKYKHKRTKRIYIYIYIYIYIGFKTFFYVVQHLDSIASYLPTGLHLGFFRSWLSLYLPSSFSSVFLVLSFVSASTSMLFWAIFLLPFSEHGRTM